MVLKNAKRILAVIVAGAMTAGASLTAFASGTDGKGVVEYDNAEDIEYDKVTVTPLVAADYDFTLDPTGLLNQYAPNKYDLGTVYFSAYASRAKIEGATPSGGGAQTKLYKKEYVEVTGSGVYSGVVTALDADGEFDTVDATKNYYVYIPDKTSNFAAGFDGKYVQISSAADFKKYFVVDNASGPIITKRPDYLADPDTFDGKLYVESYTQIPSNTIEDKDTDPLSNYVTVANGAITALATDCPLYKEDPANAGKYIAITKDDLAYTAEVVKGMSSTKTHTIVNASTKDKTVKAVVTISNVKGITFQNSTTFDPSDTTASMYLAATNGNVTEPLVLSADGETATATYTVDLAKPTIAQIKFMSDDSDTNSNTGGHNFYNYKPAQVTYTDDAFKLTAAANPNGKTAWDAWAAAIGGEADRPKVNIVYTVTDKVTDAAPSIATTTYTMVANQNVNIPVSLGVGSLAATGIKSVIWNSTDLYGSSVTYSNGTVIVASSSINYLLGDASQPRTLKIVFNDSAETEVTITLTE